MAGQERVRVGVRARVGNDHAVEFETLGVGQGDEEDAAFREAVAGAQDRDLIISQQGCGFLHAAGAGTDDGGQAFGLRGFSDGPGQGGPVAVPIVTGTEDRGVSGGLDGGDQDLLLGGQQACEEGGDLGR